MKTFRFSPAAFMIAFCGGYTLSFALNWPLFIYYPLNRAFTWGPEITPDIGPGMAWYGLVASAAIVAFPAAILLPDRSFQQLFRNRLWIFPAGAMLACIYLLREFFS